MSNGATGESLRDEGVGRVLNNLQDEWKDTYYNITTRWFLQLEEGRHFTGENMRQTFLAWGGEKPHHPNAWGAVARVMLKRWLENGQAEIVGMGAMRDPRSHARLNLVYKKTVV